MEKEEISVLEQNLTLVVKEQKLGALITNAKDIQKFVTEKLKEYTPENYKGDDKQAEKDKAELNKAIKQLNNERMRLEAEFNKPFMEFKNIVSDTCKMIQQASDQLKKLVDVRENKRKEDKRAEIENYFNSLNFNLIKLTQIFNSKWLNKTYKISDIKSEINTKCSEIKDNISKIENTFISDDVDTLKSLYLVNLNYPEIELKARQLQEKREILQQSKTTENSVTTIKASPNMKVIDTTSNNASKATVDAPKPFIFNITTPITRMAEACNLSVNITIDGSIADCKKFREMLEVNNYKYDKGISPEGHTLLKIKFKNEDKDPNSLTIF